MSSKYPRCIWILIVGFIVSINLAACGFGNTPTLPVSPSATQPAVTQQVTLAPTSQPTPTSLPLAANVNREGITLAEYQAELSRFATSQGKAGTELASDEKKRVLDDLIDTLLLAQGAAKGGYNLDAAGLQKRVDQLVVGLGSEQALKDWIAAHGYDDASFRQALTRAAAAAWMRDQIAGSVPQAGEQVHARQILFSSADQAQQVLAQIEAGSDFETLAWKYDPVSGGDLGWFCKGYLTQPALEQAAFDLQPGEHSGVIQTPLGFHLLQVIERDPQHPYTQDARLLLQEQAVKQWLADQRSQSTIQILTP